MADNLDEQNTACYTATMKTVVAMLCVSLFFFSCASSYKNLSEDFTVMELNQRAQEYLDSKNYTAATSVYNTIIDRFGQDMPIYVAARFEIAHILIKQKKWNDAFTILNELDTVYKETGGIDLPPEYFKLVTLDLEKIPEKYKY